MSPVMAVPPQPVPTPVPEPWSMTLAAVGPLLTASQRRTLLARLRVKGYPVTDWVYPPK